MGNSAEFDKQQLKVLIHNSLYNNEEPWKPFDAQLDIADAVFNRGVKVVFLRCGRGFSKTFTAAWMAAKYALENPKSIVCLYAPELKQAKRIYWYPEIIKKFIYKELIRVERGDENFYKLVNGSYIHIDGSDNTSQRGLKPNFVVADEYADFDAGWYDAMMPNIGKVAGTIVFMGTPPEFPVLHDGSEHHYVELDRMVKQLSKKSPNRYYHLIKPTRDNPHYPPSEIEEFRQQCIRRGQEFVFRREMLAEIVSGSKMQIFPMINDTHVVEHEKLLEEIKKNPSKYEYICSIDPSTRGVFAVNVILLDRYSAEVIWLDEIHETQAELTTPARMCPRIEEMLALYGVPGEDWAMWCDSAAASFIVGASEHHGMYFTPAEKKPSDKTEWLEVLADIFSLNKGRFSSRCENTFREFQMYVRDSHGRPVKARDHHIDLSRYALKGEGFSLNELFVPNKIVNPISEGRMRTIEQDMQEYRNEIDWTTQILDLYD